MGLDVDAKAWRLLDRAHAGRGVLITVVSNYGLPGEMLTVEWCDALQAQHDPDLTQFSVVNGVPIYTYRRLSSYLRWHNLHLTGRGPRWWPSLSIERAPTVWHDLVRWEQSHPGILGHRPAA